MQTIPCEATSSGGLRLLVKKRKHIRMYTHTDTHAHTHPTSMYVKSSAVPLGPAGFLSNAWPSNLMTHQKLPSKSPQPFPRPETRVTELNPRVGTICAPDQGREPFPVCPATGSSCPARHLTPLPTPLQAAWRSSRNRAIRSERPEFPL